MRVLRYSAEYPALAYREFAGVLIESYQDKNDHMGHFLSWRRRGDSNSRTRSLQSNDLANRPLQPLGYSSMLRKLSVTTKLLYASQATGTVLRPLTCVSRSSHLDTPLSPIATFFTLLLYKIQSLGQFTIFRSISHTIATQSTPSRSPSVFAMTRDIALTEEQG